MAIHACCVALTIWLGFSSLPALPVVAIHPGAPGPPVESMAATGDSKQDVPQPLKPGDEPPALSVDSWIKGGPITRFEKGNVYIVEFWATWCEPCLEGIPRLSELQRQYRSRGLLAIGVASHEFAGRKALSRFVEQRGEQIRYAIAHDGDRSMEFEWQTRGIPNRGFKMPEVFVIDAKGKIAWVGHPDSEKGEKLAKIIADLLGPPDKEEPTDTRKQGKP